VFALSIDSPVVFVFLINNLYRPVRDHDDRIANGLRSKGCTL